MSSSTAPPNSAALGVSQKNIKTPLDVKPGLFPPISDRSSEPKNVCKKCGGVGTIFSQASGGTFARECECSIRKRQEDVWRRSGFGDCDLSIELSAASRRFVESFDAIRASRKPWIFFSGKTGCGKTTQAGLIARALNRRRKPVVSRMISFFDVLRRFGANWNSWRQDEVQKELDEKLSFDLIVVDDFLKGAKRERGCDYEITCYVVDLLYRLKKPTIFTSEFSVQKIAAFDVATAGRIVQSCDGRVVQYSENAVNYRLKGR